MPLNWVTRRFFHWIFILGFWHFSLFSSTGFAKFEANIDFGGCQWYASRCCSWQRLHHRHLPFLSHHQQQQKGQCCFYWRFLSLKKLTLKLSEVFHLQSTWKESSSIIPSYFGPFDSYCIPWGQISKETSWMHNSVCHFANIPWEKDWFGGDHLSQSQYEDIKKPRNFLNIFRHYWYENQFW